MLALVLPTERAMPKRVLPESQYEAFRKLSSEMSARKVARFFQLSLTSVRRYQRKFAITERPPPMSRRLLSPAKEEQFCKLAPTMSDERLAKRFGIGATTAAKYRARLQIQRPPLPTNPHTLSVEEQELLAQSWGKESTTATARRLGRCLVTIRKYARKLGLPENPKKHLPAELSSEQIDEFLGSASDTTLTIREIARRCGISYKVGVRLRREAGLMRPSGNRFGKGWVPPIPATSLPKDVRWRCWECGRVNIKTHRCASLGCRAELGKK